MSAAAAAVTAVSQALRAFFQFGVFALVVDDVQRVETAVLLLGQRDAQPHQLGDFFLARHRDQHVFARRAFARPLRPFDGDVVGAALRGEGRNRAGRQYHQNRAVEHRFVQQADGFALGRAAQYHVVAHHHRRQRRRHVGAAQSEEQRALVAAQPEGLLRQAGRYVFGRRHHDDHDDAHFDALPALEERAVVDEHPHAYQKEGDEDGVAHEFDAVHQRRGPGNEPVHGQSRQESADDGFEPRQLGEVGS